MVLVEVMRVELNIMTTCEMVEDSSRDGRREKKEIIIMFRISQPMCCCYQFYVDSMFTWSQFMWRRHILSCWSRSSNYCLLS